MGDYGYDAGTPCVAVKMNRIFEFMPEVDGGGDDILIECKGQRWHSYRNQWLEMTFLLYAMVRDDILIECKGLRWPSY